ncbi:glycosyltransferase [Celerinatantimonas sp. MCCC 1A17872]|uniref:glycosyltransferase n=1 Tax=Celerinatantimonas sp. MCCC 1A17872 TaxID=3177514 RepID=UPI0038C1D927
MEDIYNIIDIFLYPARIEEFGLVVSEAMACGCAIITTEHVGANELFTGLSKECICNSNQMMREKIEQLVTDAPLRKEISITNALDVQKTSLENFSSLFLKTLSKIDIE